MKDDRTDEQLVASYLDGDRSALAGIYDRYADSLYSTAATMLNDRHEAADVMQDVILVAAERLGQLRDTSRLKPWLFAILRNEVFKRTKRRTRTRPTDFNAAEVPEMVAAADPAHEGGSIAAAELAELVHSAASGLDDRDRLVLELSVRQGLAGADLADALGVTPEQSYVLVHRMRDRVERGIGALTVARMGRKDCPELSDVLSGWDGTFSVLVRKRVARHIERCEVCERTKKKAAIIPLLGATPALAAPIDLRDRILALAGEATPTPRADYEFAESDGFPVPLDGGRRGRLALIIGAAVAGVLLIGGGIAALVGNDDGASTATPTTAAATTIAPAEAGAGVVIVSEPAVEAAPTVPVDTEVPATSETLAPDTSVTVATTVDPATTVVPPTSDPAASTPVTTSPKPGTTAPRPGTTVAPGPVAPLPTNPPETAPPVTPAPAAPGQLVVSAGTIDLGTASSAGAVTLSNTGGSALTWSVQDGGSPAPFGVSATGGTLEPGAATQLTITLDRATQPEGSLGRSFGLSSSGGGGGTVGVSARIERRPVVTLTKGPENYPEGSPTKTCPNFAPPTPTVRVSVSDESAIASVTVSYNGPGASGGGALASVGGGQWQGNLTVPYDEGTWTYTITATDARGNSGSVQSTTVVGCPAPG